MREIKFRAWDKRNRAIVSWKTILKECDRLSILTYSDYEIMQYTGLKDKNGKEIFEGDILQRDKEFKGFDEEMIEQPYSLKPFEVKWSTPYKAGWDIWGTPYEIIGNIYENKELLGGEK